MLISYSTRIAAENAKYVGLKRREEMAPSFVGDMEQRNECGEGTVKACECRSRSHDLNDVIEFQCIC